MRILLLAALLCSCGGAAAVRLTNDWPAQPGDYHAVTKAWTRSDKIIHDYDTVLDVSATFLSPEWRAAYVARRARDEKLTEAETAALRDEQAKIAAEFYEVELLVTTYQYPENDLQKGDKSMWRLALVDAEGTQVRPAEIKIDRRTGSLLQLYFPEYQPFDRAFVVRFPRTVDMLKPGAAQFALRMASAHGSVDLVWKAR